jgi:SAM-dependent methyltransferase
MYARRVRSVVLPLLASYQGSEWLTVGDGGLAADAYFLQQHGVRALATDISTDLLAEAKRLGRITDYRRENAERLSFSDGTFDFVHCKESYHHFPRPLLALYEMLRVARQGVVLIEPNDPWISGSALAPVARAVFRGIRRAMGKTTPRHTYEVSGNYLYTLSVREMEKAAVGMNLPAIGYRHFNFFYRPGVETAPAMWKHPLFIQGTFMLAAKNVLSRLGLVPYGMLAVVLFTASPSADAVRRLRAGGFRVVTLPRNPYLAHD